MFALFSTHTRKVANMSTNKPFESEIIDGDILAIILNGPLDAASAPEFDKEIQAHLDAGRSKVIIDCRNMPYISSLGMGSLVILQREACLPDSPSAGQSAWFSLSAHARQDERGPQASRGRGWLLILDRRPGRGPELGRRLQRRLAALAGQCGDTLRVAV